MEIYLPMIAIAVLGLLAVAVVVNGVILHKVRRIHLATFGILDDVAATRREAEALFAQVQSLMALERLLGLPRALPQMRGWAGSPDFLLRVAEEILARRAATVMECSSGVSTVVCARALQMNGRGHVYSLEHDERYAQATRNMLDRYGLGAWATVIEAPLECLEGRTSWYSLRNVPQNLPPIDVLVVDGPPTSTGVLARYPALPTLAGRLAECAVLIVDDAARDDDRKMLARWKDEFPEFQQRDAYCEKGCVLVERARSNRA